MSRDAVVKATIGFSMSLPRALLWSIFLYLSKSFN